VDHLFALPIIARHIKQTVDTSQVTVVSPDAGRVRVAEKWTDTLGAPLAIIHKRRDPDVPNQVKMFEVVGEVKGRICVIVDDMIDTGGTIVKAAETLFEAGAKDVIVTATHGIFSEPAKARLSESGISKVYVTDTLPIPEDRRFDKLEVLSIAPLIAHAISEVFNEGSVTALFDDNQMDIFEA
jgi:ribose-phosphate pyrophosphokinase